MKTCSRCNIEKPKQAFYKSKSTKDGFHTICSICDSLRKKEYYQENKEAIRLKQADYYKNNKEKVRASNKAWKKTNHASVIRSATERKHKVKIATPKWLTETQKQEIFDMYWLAKDLSSVTEGKYHVDHITPLRGENVCGLHVPWNLQILPDDVNLSKNNRISDVRNIAQKISDKKTWDAVKSGKLPAFSIGGRAVKGSNND